MHQRKNELSTIFEAGPAKVPAEDWGDMRVAIVSVPAGTDFGLLLKGHPDNLCPSPHWGYVIKGRLKIEFPDGKRRFRRATSVIHHPVTPVLLRKTPNFGNFTAG